MSNTSKEKNIEKIDWEKILEKLPVIRMSIAGAILITLLDGSFPSQDNSPHQSHIQSQNLKQQKLHKDSIKLGTLSKKHLQEKEFIDALQAW